jgi:hypothetical protein
MCANYGFLPCVGSFSPGSAKKNLQKTESTMLPQATIAFAYVL